MKKILLVEDQNLIIKSLKLSLGKYYNLQSVQTFNEAKEVDISHMDLILLDISLPDGSGIDLFKHFKQYKNIPIIFLTANDEEETIVRAFDLGADDYLTKPFKTGELLARIKKNLPDSLIFNNIELDLNSYKVYQNKRQINLSPTEIELLEYMIVNKNRLLSREELLNIWALDDKFVNDNTLSVYVKRLREKLNLSCLKTSKGLGYILYEKD